MWTLLHGFTGSRDELAVAGTQEGVFSRTARLGNGDSLSKRSICSR